MQRVTAADYHDIATPDDPRLSPDGTRVAFLRTQPLDDETYESTVYLVDVAGDSDADPDGEGAPRRLTLAEGRDAEPRWSPSGDRIAFVSTRGGDDDRKQLWVLPVDGGEARQVTDVVGGVSEIAWSPDGERIAFVQPVTPADREADRDLSVPEEYEPEDHPDPRVVERTVYRTQQRYFDGRRSAVYLVDADATVDGARADEEPGVVRVTDREADFGGPEFGDADTLYYWESVGEDPDDSDEFAIHALDLADAMDVEGDADTEEEVGTEDDGNDALEAASPDAVELIHTTTAWQPSLSATADGRIAFPYIESDQASLQQTDLHVFDRGSASVTDVTAGVDRGLDTGTTPQWGPDAETLYFATPDEGMTALWHAPGDGSADPERLLREGIVSSATVGVDADAGADSDANAGSDAVRLAIARSEWDHPGDVFAYDAATDATTRLTELNAAYLADRHVGKPEELWFESEHGPVHGWVLTPPEFDATGATTDEADENAAEPDEEYPLAVEIHGGPHAMWSTSGTMWHEFRTLAARGYVVFWSNPRGSTGYGEAYKQAIERDWGEVTLTDVMAGVEEVAARPYVDESNAFVTGGSFGGFMTAWAVGRSDYFRAAVSQRGAYDLTGLWGTTDGAYKLVEGNFDTLPSEEAGWLWEQSPTGHAHEVDTPTLLIHSEDDTRTPIGSAELFYRILRTNGVETRFVRYPREGHELSRSGEPGHVVDRIERIVRWFDGYSEHHDVPKALDRPEDDGLTASADDEE